jgi:hypothetical protein
MTAYGCSSPKRSFDAVTRATNAGNSVHVFAFSVSGDSWKASVFAESSVCWTTSAMASMHLST